MPQVSEVMTRDVVTIAPDAPIRRAAELMDSLNVGSLPVCDGKRLVGMITDRDITVRATAAGGSPDDTPVGDVMTDQVRFCFADDDIADVERTMSDVQIRRVPVVDGDRRLVGIVSLGDLAAMGSEGVDETLEAISEPAKPDRSGVAKRT